MPAPGPAASRNRNDATRSDTPRASARPPSTVTTRSADRDNGLAAKNPSPFSRTPTTISRPQIRSVSRVIIDTATSAAPRTIRYQPRRAAGVVYDDESAAAHNTTPVTANSTAMPAFSHQVRVCDSARTASVNAPNSTTGPATDATSDGSSRITHQEIASHATPANIRKPHMFSRTTVRGFDPDHNMRPPEMLSLTMTTFTEPAKPCFRRKTAGSCPAGQAGVTCTAGTPHAPAPPTGAPTSPPPTPPWPPPCPPPPAATRTDSLPFGAPTTPPCCATCA